MSVSQFFAAQRSAQSSPSSTTPQTSSSSPVSIKPAHQAEMKDQFKKLVEEGKLGHVRDIAPRAQDYEP